MDDLYVRLQKALDEGVPTGHFAGCSMFMGIGWACDCQFAEFFQRLIERDRKLLAEYQRELDVTREWLDEEAVAEVRRSWQLQLDSAAEFWLTDTETTDGQN
jgi:hypothetical protein